MHFAESARLPCGLPKKPPRRGVSILVDTSVHVVGDLAFGPKVGKLLAACVSAREKYGHSLRAARVLPCTAHGGSSMLTPRDD